VVTRDNSRPLRDESFLFLFYSGGVPIGNYEVTYEEILKAVKRLEGVIHQTPLQHSRTFSKMTNNEVYMKFENLQKTGAFKIRGAYNKVASLSPTDRKKGIITASAGNHAQGVSLAAHQYGVPSFVVMPEGAPVSKIQATEGYGSKVILHGKNYDEAYKMALALSQENGATFIHAFDDPQVIAGQGTVGYEMLKELPDLDAIVIPVGGGGLISGIAIAAKHLHPKVQIIGVQPEGSNAGFLSWLTGRRQSIPSPSSIADGLSVKQLGKLPYAIIHKYVDSFITVSEQQIKQAMFLTLERAKVMVEGAGATSLAGLLSGKLPLQNKKIAIVLSGGNLDVMRLSALSERGKAI